MAGEKNIFQSYTRNKVFIETGSFKGDGIQRALDVGFETIISIEYNKKYYDMCVDRFKNNKNVKIYLGDSVSTLPEILVDIKEGVTFFLDAHLSESTDVFCNKECPLIEEIGVIVNHAKNYNDIVLIDDLRVWVQDKYDFDFVDLQNALITDSANPINFSFDAGFVPNDILVAEFNSVVEAKVEEVKAVEEPIKGNIRGLRANTIPIDEVADRKDTTADATINAKVASMKFNTGIKSKQKKHK